jgi:hypothetical protein
MAERERVIEIGTKVELVRPYFWYAEGEVAAYIFPMYVIRFSDGVKIKFFEEEIRRA